MQTHYPAIIIGAGQAGLSLSYCLTQRGIEHILFEQKSIGYAWREQRWDSFCLVTPNWQCDLPGFPYDGDDPHGFMSRDEIVGYIKRYVELFIPPVKEGVTVKALRQSNSDEFELDTSIGSYTADQVIVATGAYHRPKIPAIAERLPQDILQLHSSDYKNPQVLPDGAVLIVGTGQSGCQIAEDLHLAGRRVHLCVGGAPRSPRTYRGKDVVEWLHQMGYYDLSIDEHPQKETVRTKTNHYLTGRDGGREIDLRQFALEGMGLYGRLNSVQGTQLTFQSDLKQNLDQADGVAESIKQSIDKFIDTRQISAPVEPAYMPVWEPKTEILSLDLRDQEITSVIWSIGYTSDFSWVKIPVFDGTGYPGHNRGVTPVKGLYFLGLPWLYTWGSGRFSGIARDAQYLTDQIVSHHKVAYPQEKRSLNPEAIGS